MNIRNLDWIRKLKIPDAPDAGARLYEAFKSISNASDNTEQQGNLNPQGQPVPPPGVQAINVTAENGHHSVTLEDQNSGVRRGVNYWLERSTSPSFANPHIIDLGQTRSHSEFLGNGTYYWRGYSSYSSSPGGQPVYHGSASSPAPVNAGGSVGPPGDIQSQGSGTGAPGQGLVGPGPVPIRAGASGFDWTKQRPQGSRGGFVGSGTPAGSGAASGSGGGGGGTPVTSQGLIVDTHANRLANYPSVRYPVTTQFYESDRTVNYWIQNASGTVTVTTGTTVTWVSGNHFINTGTGFTAAQWPAGTPIVINGVTCRVSVVNSATSITLQTATTNAAGVSYLVTSGRWVYLDDAMQKAWASLPTDLGENDVAVNGGGFIFFDNTDSLHIWQWTGAAWGWGPGDRHSGEFGQFDASPGVGWHLCNGDVNQTKYAANGTRVTNFTVPDQRGFYLKGSGSYSGSGVAAVAPTINAFTGSTASGAANIGDDTDTGVIVLPGVGATVAENPHTHIDSGHTHAAGTLAATAGTDGLPATFAVLPYYRL